MHWASSIFLAYSLFSPIVLLCGLLYFSYKYYIDRYIILDIYAHRRYTSLFGAAFGFKSDYISHYKMAVTNSLLVIGNLFVFAFFQAAFYGSKIPSDRRFAIHTIISALVCFILFVFIPILKFFMSRRKEHQIEAYTYKQGYYNTPLSSMNTKKWYEPSTTYEFIPQIATLNDIAASKANE
jgi:hypothetical protein